MMKKKMFFVTLMLLAMTSFVGADNSFGAEIVPVEGVKSFVDDSVAANLENFKGRYVALYLNSGQVVKGYVKNVGKQMVQLSELERKDFFDAMISMNAIIGFEVQVRMYDNGRAPRVLK